MRFVKSPSALPGIQQVHIVIKPGNYPNCFNNDGHGVIPVAILGSATFDATQVNVATVSLSSLPVNAAGNGTKLLASFDDVNGDAFVDLVVQIEDVDSVFTTGAAWATLTSLLYNGTAFE